MEYFPALIEKFMENFKGILNSDIRSTRDYIDEGLNIPEDAILLEHYQLIYIMQMIDKFPKTVFEISRCLNKSIEWVENIIASEPYKRLVEQGWTPLYKCEDRNVVEVRPGQIEDFKVKSLDIPIIQKLLKEYEDLHGIVEDKKKFFKVKRNIRKVLKWDY